MREVFSIATPVVYVGRFAPSPTGPLHFGSLVAALGSYLEARTRGGRWLLRMEDVDEPRCSTAATDGILRALDACGFQWDGTVLKQSARKMRYRDVLAKLQNEGLVYPCACTRKELADSALTPDAATIYPGTCRNGLARGKTARAWRLRVNGTAICFTDAVQGSISQHLARETGDFILLRADGYFAYQLAVVIDDADQGVTHVVRGADLLNSTPRQIYLQRCLGLPTPDYAHLPVAVNTDGKKLSKQTLATAVDSRNPVPPLLAAMRFLGQAAPPEMTRALLTEFWAWALSVWDLGRVPRVPCQPALTVGFPAAQAGGEADSSPCQRISQPAGGPF
jgi:glutamyl-Q tRNA(Asp) synthetase